MLAMTLKCECCERGLGPDSLDAMICSFECTFCESCTSGKLQNTCPNCGGDLQRRPTREAKYLDRYPPSPSTKPKSTLCSGENAARQPSANESKLPAM